MTTIIPLLDSDLLINSRSDINNNFASLNADKLEASDISSFETTTELNARDTANRNRANHTGTQTANTISDFDIEVSNNTDVSANTTARHTHSNKAILDNTTASFTITDETKLDGIEIGAEVNTLNDVIAGTNITIDKTDPLNPVISSTGGGGGGTGDLLASNNLSDLADIPTARTNLDVYSTTETDNLLDDKLNKNLTLLDSIDLDTIVDNGFYCANATCTNLPETSVKTRLRVNQDPTNANLALQEALTTTTLVSYVRKTTDGGTTWSAWTRVKATDETKQTILSEGAFVNGDKTKLDNIEAGAEVNVNADWNSVSGDSQILNKPAIPTNSDYVDLTTNQTIAGVKTFSSSPIIPTPTTDYQSATKKYVDDEIAAIPAGGGSIRRMFAIAGSISATGTNVANTWVVDGTYTISQVNLWYGTAGNGTLTVDVNLGGTTIFASTKPSITGTNQASLNTGVLTTTSLVSGNVLTVDIDAVPGTAGVDLYIELVLI